MNIETSIKADRTENVAKISFGQIQMINEGKHERQRGCAAKLILNVRKKVK